MQKVKLAVYNDKKIPGDGKVWSHYVEYGPLYAATYGFRKMGNIEGQLWEFFPNTGRFYFIPVLPQGNEPLGAGIRNLPVSKLQKESEVKSLFDAAYPTKQYEGDALVFRIGHTLTIQNSRENEDVTESFSLPLNLSFKTSGPEKYVWLKTFAGKVPPHAYQIGKIEDQGRRLWLQANTEYPGRESEMSFFCQERPDLEVTPTAALKKSDWDDQRKCLTIILSHQAGAAEVMIKAGLRAK
jgi:hypothetical protein